LTRSIDKLTGAFTQLIVLVEMRNHALLILQAVIMTRLFEEKAKVLKGGEPAVGVIKELKQRVE
jgi:hypothetical protein